MSPSPARVADVEQVIESVIDTLKANFRSKTAVPTPLHGLAVRIAQRLLALTACLWHKWQIHQPGRRLTVYDH